LGDFITVYYTTVNNGDMKSETVCSEVVIGEEITFCIKTLQAMSPLVGLIVDEMLRL